MQHSIEHDLDIETARLVARHAVESYAARFAKYGFESRWVSDDKVDLAFEVKGKRVDGCMRVEPDRLIFELDVPFIFRVFSGRATQIIDEEARMWIDRAKAGELDLTG